MEIAKTLDTTDPNPSKNQGGIAIVEPVPYTLKIRSGCEGGGKGALIQEDKSATLATSNDQYLFQPIAFAQNQRDEVRDLKDKAGALNAEPGMKQQTFIAVPNISLEADGFKTGQGDAGDTKDCAGADDREGKRVTHTFQNTGQGWWNESCVGTTLRTPGGGDSTLANIVVEAAGFKAGQGAQARSIGWENEKCPTLAAEAGGNSVPSVCVKCYDARGNGDGQTVNTLTEDHENRITDYSSVVVEKKPVYCLQGNGIDRADTAGCNGKGWKKDASYTLNTIDRHAVAFQTYQKVSGSLMANSHPGSYTGQDAFGDMLVAGVDCRNFTEYPDLYQTLQSKPNGGQSLNFSGAVRVQYIVRRLTPTECARLQGFPDDWGHPDHKEDFTEEEYRVWLDVRNTYASINGKPKKDYTKAQMITWYNRLHTDSGEYKMWGNGIALPCALYVMQGIADAIRQR